jgi:glycosyltransferase involved in cell wall biosynthesis
MKKKTVLFYDSEALSLLSDPLHPSGGAAKQVLAWSKGLSDIGINTMIAGAHKNVSLFYGKQGIFISYNPDKGLKIFRYLYYRTPRIILSLYRSKAEYIYSGIPSHFAGLLAIITKVLRKKFILRISNDFFFNECFKKRSGWFRYVFFKIGFVLSDYIICQNSHQYNKIITKFPDKTHILANPYSRGIDEKPTPLKDRSFISWIGIIQYQKNIPLLLTIAKGLPDYKFKIAGCITKTLNLEDTYALEELRNLSNVTLLGFISADDVINLLRRSYILLNTSHYEGFSNTFLEAFSTGTPVFTLQQNDPSDIIKTQKLGYIYNSIDDFKNTVFRITQNRQNFKCLSDNCIKYMKDNHDLIYQSMKFSEIIGR